MWRQIRSIARKELTIYFGSPLAFIFLGVFLAAVLFIFFTIETFFARGIADVRPLFRWMPVLLIFLIAALTMRQWSEERRAGTEELLLTLPVHPIALVLGKFLAVMAIIALALVLTLPLPITVSIIGNLDWGPVFGGYLAALLLASAYTAIGLFVSSRTDNQIVSLILTVLLGGLFYLIGTRSITDLVGGGFSEIFWALGTGSRFESIERGVLDLGDLIYYLSLTAFFLSCNTISLDSIRWSSKQTSYRRQALLTFSLLSLNLLVLNIWFFAVSGLRLDITQQREYSLSQTTKDLLDNLQEPLLIRAYVSEKNHPLLKPLVPGIRDMLREYEIASNGQVTAEVVDPIQDPEIEAEANQSYGIQPSPFQIADRYEASVINAYFDILVRYGDQSVVLNFQDLIQVDSQAGGDIDVRLRNLEYDLTSAIKRAVFGFQSVDTILAELEEPVRLNYYITPDSLPATITTTLEVVDQVAQEIASDSNGKLIYQIVDPTDPNSPVDRQWLFDNYGLRPIPVSFFSPDTYYAYLVLENGDEVQVIPPLTDPTEADVRTAIESALKRTAPGFLKVVGLVTPAAAPQDAQFAVTQPLSSYRLIQEQLGQSYTLQSVDLSGGQVPSNIDALLVIAPQDLTDRELYAVDQFLMRGGSVVLATSPYQVSIESFSSSLILEPGTTTNIRDWLEFQGINLSNELVLDPQNQPFPVAVQRGSGQFVVQEIQAVDYPFFIDVRPDGMDRESAITANLPAVTMNWASPLEVEEEVDAGRETSVLMRSSEQSWKATDTNVQPDYQLFPDIGFPIGADQDSYPLAVSLQGKFESYFKDRPTPFEEQPGEEPAVPGALEGEDSTQDLPPATIIESPESTRLVVFASTAFAEDTVLDLSSRFTADRYLTNLQLVQNAVDWSVEDLDLLAIRSRGTVSRVLEPLDNQEQSMWEIGNYVVALIVLLVIFFAWRMHRRSQEPVVLTPTKEEV